MWHDTRHMLRDVFLKWTSWSNKEGCNQMSLVRNLFLCWLFGMFLPLDRIGFLWLLPCRHYCSSGEWRTIYGYEWMLNQSSLPLVCNKISLVKTNNTIGSRFVQDSFRSERITLVQDRSNVRTVPAGIIISLHWSYSLILYYLYFIPDWQAFLWGNLQRSGEGDADGVKKSRWLLHFLSMCLSCIQTSRMFQILSGKRMWSPKEVYSW